MWVSYDCRNYENQEQRQKRLDCCIIMLGIRGAAWIILPTSLTSCQDPTSLLDEQIHMLELSHVGQAAVGQFEIADDRQAHERQGDEWVG